MGQKIKVIGTGLTGLVGSRVVELASDIFDWNNLSRFSGVDITDEKCVSDVIEKNDSDTLVHFAAFTDLDEAEKQKNNKNGSCYQINVIGTKNIALACAKKSKHLIYISTDAVFDGKKNVPYVETDKPNPINWYGQTKWLGEQEIAKSGCKFTILRIAYPFRAKFENKKDFVRKLLDRFSKKEKLKMFSDTLFTPTYIDDVAKALKIIIQVKPLGIFHAVGSSILSPFQAAAEIAEIFGLDLKSIQPTSLSDYLADFSRSYPRWAGLSNSKIKTELGISMSGFKEALKIVKEQAGREIDILQDSR